MFGGRLLVLFLLFTVMMAGGALAEENGFLEFIGDLSDVTDLQANHPAGVSFFLFAFLFAATFWIGISQYSGWRGLGNKTRNASIIVIIILGLIGSWGLVQFQKAQGYWIIDRAGPFALLFFILVVLGLIGFLAFKKSEEKHYFLLISIFYVGIYYILNWLFSDFTDALGFAGGLIEVIFVICAVYLIWFVGRFAFNAFRYGPPNVSKEQLEEKNESEKALAKYEKKKARRKASKDFRKSKRAVRNLKPKLDEAKEVISTMRDGAAEADKKKVVRGNKKVMNAFSRSNVKKLEQLKQDISAYAGLLSDLATEVESVAGTNPVATNDKSKLDVFKNDLLAQAKDLGKKIEKLEGACRVLWDSVQKKTPLPPNTWEDLSNLLKKISNKLGKIRKDSLAALILEKRIKKALKN